MPPFFSNPPDPLNERLRIALARAKTAVNDEEVAVWYLRLTQRRYQLWCHAARVESLIVFLGWLAERPTNAKFELARRSVLDLCRDLDVPLPVERVGASRRASAWLAGCAARVLPARSRARYREEFEAELLEIGRGWRQIVHGVRVLGRAVPLRWELRRPVRERAR
jgi:hypothetical protein